MSLFDRFVEALQRRAVVDYGGYASVGGQRTDIAARRGNADEIKAMILDRLPDTNHFVMTKEAIFGASPELGANNPLAPNMMDLDVAPPFKTCWFQLGEAERPTGIIDYHHGERMYALWLEEIGAHSYRFCFMLDDKDNPELMRFRFGMASTATNHDVWHAIALWLQPFSRGYVGALKKTSDRVKYRDANGDKQLYKIRKVVMVYPKNMTTKQRQEAESEGIDFTHRFDVRAHWRRLFYLDGRVDQ